MTSPCPGTACYCTGATRWPQTPNSARAVSVAKAYTSDAICRAAGEARERVQFGRPIGSFQAVKHKCATMRLWVQAATAATYYAAMAVHEALRVQPASQIRQ